jgi:hypothetical protein
MANSIVREREAPGAAAEPKRQSGARGDVVGEIMGDIDPWRRLRDADFMDLWDEYYAKWRGFWMPQHKSFKTERSKLISPLTAMSVDLTSAEIIEAVLGREYFIDLPDDFGDEEQEDMETCRRLLVQDLRKEGFVDEFALTALNGCLYGTGITKIQILTKKEKTLRRNSEGEMAVTEREVVQIKPVAIEPGSFVADPSSRSIDEMKGCAHEFTMPLTTLSRRQAEGIYDDTFVVGSYRAKVLAPNRGDTDVGSRRDTGDVAYITEYYGLITERSFLKAKAEAAGNELTEAMVNAIPSKNMIEVIATIANETHLLRVMANPLITGERLIVSYQHEAVPNRFYGRGVCEKGANVQRAMDAEMRSRIDALAWSNNPMFAGDLTRMPPGSNMNAWPGKFWGTRGNPAEVLQEFRISGPDQNSYAHMQDLERMGAQATGAMDSAGLRGGVRDETATGSALAASSFIKRSKRTMYNIEGYMQKLVRRTLHLKMQYEPARYPLDYEFQVKGSIGIMAREIEQQFMTNLVGVIGQDSPAAMPIITAIFEHSGSPAKGDVLRALKAISEKKPTPEEEASQRATLAIPVAQHGKLMAETRSILAKEDLSSSQADKLDEEVENMQQEYDLDKAKLMDQFQQTKNQMRQLDLMDDKNALTERGLQIQAASLRQGKK